MQRSPLSPRHHQFSNWFQSVLLIGSLLILVSASAWILFGGGGVFFALAFTAFGLFFGRRATSAMVLSMYKARPIGRQEAPHLMETFERLCEAAQLNPAPQLFYIPSRMANAFAVGQGRGAAVAITDGLVRMMNHREMAGILAHEITHVRCRDTTTMGIADIISRSVSTVARVGFFMMLFSASSFLMGRPGWNVLLSAIVMMMSPMFATMIQLALSRTREFNADRGAALLTGDPDGLASALLKLERQKMPRGIWERLFGRPDVRKQSNMLRTHPPTEDRVAALAAVKQELASLIERESVATPVVSDLRRFELENRPKVSRGPAYHLASGLWW